MGSKDGKELGADGEMCISMRGRRVYRLPACPAAEAERRSGYAGVDDLKFHEFFETKDMISWWTTCGTRDFCRVIVECCFDEVYQLAVDMGSRRLHLHRRA